ncbi:hypothetical protein MsedE_1052 [Metallosphaera sedula]|uniref:Uncharacterized protein n=1 Tax=Metallosphaera sedula TaxID=43687 RepID=A0A0K1T834_9CREN|nr:hypothetical protein MsedE_1052 [Metallosphaera sedula]
MAGITKDQGLLTMKIFLELVMNPLMDTSKAMVKEGPSFLDLFNSTVDTILKFYHIKIYSNFMIDIAKIFNLV